MKVLLLESVVMQAILARDALVAAGYTLDLSRFEQDGIQRVRDWDPDVVILSNVYAREDIASFCSRMKAESGRTPKIVIASSLPLHRLLEKEPTLEPLVDAFVLRPYSSVELREVLDTLTGRLDRSLLKDPDPASLEGKEILVFNNDSEVSNTLLEHLKPKGIKVNVVHWERIEAFSRTHTFHAIILGWPLPHGYSVDMLKRLREREGADPLPVIVFTRMGLKDIQVRSPALLHVTSRFFTKPVDWDRFSRFLFRLLAEQSDKEASHPARQPSDREGGMRDFSQQQTEDTLPAEEEIRKRLKAAEDRARLQDEALAGHKRREDELEARLDVITREKSEVESRVREALELENRDFRNKMEEALKKAEVDVAKHRFRETELETHLNSLIREKSESDRRAQEVIEVGDQKSGEMQRLLEDALAELQIRGEETESLKGDLERAIIDKEQAEERNQGSLLSMEKEGREFDRERKVLLQEAEESKSAIAGLQQRVEELQSTVEEAGKRESGLRGELSRMRESSAAGESRAAALEEELNLVRSSEGGETEDSGRTTLRLAELQSSLEERRTAAAELEERLREMEGVVSDLREKLRSSDTAVAGLDEEISRYRHRAAESAAVMADMEAQNARQAVELEEAKERESRGGAEREAELRESEASRARLEGRLRELEGELGGLRAAASAGEGLTARVVELEEVLREREGALAALEEKMGSDEAAAGGLEAELRESEASRARLEGRLRELEGELGGLRAAASAGEGLTARVVELEELLREKEKEARSAQDRSAVLEGELRGQAETLRQLDEKHREELQEQRRQQSLLQERLTKAAKSAEAAAAGSRDYESMQQLLEDVVSRAQSEVIERTRKETELRERLETSIEEKKSLLARLDRDLAEASQREHRLSDLLEKALRGSAELASSLGESGQKGEHDNLPVALPEPMKKPLSVGAALAAVFAVLAMVGGAWLILRGPGDLRPSLEEDIRESPSPPDSAEGQGQPSGPPAGAEMAEGGGVSPQKVWQRWTRSDASGGVLLQATLRSRDEIVAEVMAEKESWGWSDEKADYEGRQILKLYDFEKNMYFYLYLKNLKPGYPSYVEDIYSRLVLRDDRGNETRAFLPPDLEEYRKVYSFASGKLSKNREELIYEVSIPVAFPRRALAAGTSYVELLAYNIGASSKRVLTWEFE